MPKANQSLNSDGRDTAPGAVRIFFADEKTGHPVAGLLVSFFSDTPRATSSSPTASSRNQRQQLASLQTDSAGYVSFKFDRASLAANSHLVVTYGAGRGDALVLNVADLLAGPDTHTIHLDASAQPPTVPHLGLPSVLSPDVQDLAVSPASIGLIPHLSTGSGLCGQLAPTVMGVRRFGAFHILPDDICHPTIVNCAGNTQFVHGTMLEYEITWNPVGTALGELLNTITLAPCEQVNVAVADWMRREMASQTQATDVQQQSFQEMTHDRLILETMQSTVKNKSIAGAVGGSRSSGLSFPLKDGAKLDLTSSFAGGFSGSAQTQNIAINTTNQLSEHITQAASFVASQRSTIVFQATASEQQTYQTRTVRNHNHCHTLTLVYYQINRNYLVETDYKGKRDVILVKYDNADFDAQRAYCSAEVLKEALLDQSLLPCFDELADALFCCDKKPVGKDVLMDSLTITLKVADFALNPPSGISLILATINGQVNLPPISMQGIQVGATFTQTVNLPGPIDPKTITSVVAFFTYNFSIHSFAVSSIDITYHAVSYNTPLSLYSSQALTSVGSFLDMPAKAELPPITTGANPCVDESCCVQKLLGHLNCHKRYYNNLLWLSEDPNERIMRWSCCLKDEGPFSLISQIENDPITIYGDFVVFPAAGSQLVDDSSVLPVFKLVTMPTPGVYSEGILGQCDTCERIDPNRFWNWKDSPCPDNAPAVASPPNPQADVKPGDLKTDAISNLITFSSVPDAPDSVLKDLLSSLVSKADSGSAEAKELLNNLLQKLLEKVK